jgi:NAD+ synthase
MVFKRESLHIDPEGETERICDFIRSQVLTLHKRKGMVVGLSGGVDSALLACLGVRALGAERVRGLILPERESSSESAVFALKQASALGILSEVVEITTLLDAFGVYEKRNAVVRDLFEDFDPETDEMKITLPPDLLHQDSLNVFSLIIKPLSGAEVSYRLRPEELHAITSAQNIKQRTRMIQLYYCAENSHFVVGGTTNRTEMEQGFFVKHGDGGVDIEPLAHLYKTQVFQLAEHLGVIEEIRTRTPTPDTWPGGVTDEEVYFRMPFKTLDLLLFAWNEGTSEDDTCRVLNLTTEQVGRAFRDFQSKQAATWHLRTSPPSLAEKSPNRSPAAASDEMKNK